MDTYGIDYLRNKLSVKAQRVGMRYRYYEMKNQIKNVSPLIPPEFRAYAYSLGWCAKAVDSLADRIVYDRFDNDDFNLTQIYSQNNADILFDSVILSAFISSCSFIYIDSDSKYPRLEAIDGGNATGVIDTVTNLLSEGYAVLSRNKYGYAETEAYFLPYRTEYYKGGKIFDVYEHKSPYPLLVPVINRPDARRAFGHSRISRTCMDIVQSAVRTLLRAEVTAEFYSVPQKYTLGLSQDAGFDKKRARYSDFLNLPQDENGIVPKVGQFSQVSMSPHMEHIKMLASMFAGETGLTLDDLGFNTANPASYDAIRASHENLRLTARKAQRNFGTGFLNAGYLAACIRDNYSYDRAAFADCKCAWLPIFEPDTAALGAAGDAILKINQAVPDFIGNRNIRQLTGLESDSQ
jgi:hypothetical protein